MPVLDQSVARHVGLAGLKMRTPSSISLTIARFDSSKRLLRWSFSTNLVPGLSSCQKGCICVAMLKAYETWFSSPNHKRASVIFLGVGKSRMALRYHGHGLTLSGPI